MLIERAIAWFVVAGGLVALIQIVQRYRRHDAIIPWEPRRPVPWGFVGVAPVLLLCVGAAVLRIVSEFMPVDEARRTPPIGPDALALGILNQIALVCIPVALVVSLFGAPREDLGLSTSHLRWDIKQGALAFCAVAWLIFGVQAILVNYVSSKHPLIKVLGPTPSFALLSLVSLQVIVVAPFVEELAFRAILQGWLEKVFGFEPPAPGTDGQSAMIATPPEIQRSRPRWRNAMPIVISALVFALVHLHFRSRDDDEKNTALAHATSVSSLPGPLWPDPDPIPLFLLALVLGFLYQRTHRIWASLTVHVLLNATSTALLWAEYLSQGGTFK